MICYLFILHYTKSCISGTSTYVIYNLKLRDIFYDSSVPAITVYNWDGFRSILILIATSEETHSIKTLIPKLYKFGV